VKAQAEATSGNRVVVVEPKFSPEEEKVIKDLARISKAVWLTRDELALYLNVSVKTVDDMTRDGMLPVSEFKTSPTSNRPMKRYRRETVDRWLEAGGR
jgi:hypothetical protein